MVPYIVREPGNQQRFLERVYGRSANTAAVQKAPPAASCGKHFIPDWVDNDP